MDLSVSTLARSGTGNREGQTSSPEREKGRRGQILPPYSARPNLGRGTFPVTERQDVQRPKPPRNLCSHKDKGDSPSVSSPKGPFPTLLGMGNRPMTQESPGFPG